MSREPEEQLGELLFGELGPEERHVLEQRIERDPELRKRATDLEAITSMLEALPAEAWETLGESTRELSKPSRRAPARLRYALVAAACALLLGAGVGIGVLIERPGTSGGPTVVLHALAGTSSSEQAVARMTAGGRMVLTVEHLPATGPGDFYELWLMNSTSSLVSVASFRVGANGRAELDVPLPVAASHYRYLDISLQQAAAGPAHSGDSVLRAAIPA